MSIRKFRAGRVSTVTADEHIGQYGDVFYDEATGQFRVSDGSTPGGHIVQTTLDLTNSTANIFVNNITVAGTTTTVNNITANNQTTLTGVLTVTGNASFTGYSEFVGPSEFTGDTVFIGNVTEVGNLTITGKAINNGPSIFNGPMTITGDTSVIGNVALTGNSNITGNTFVTGPTTVTGLVTITGNSVQTGLGKYIINLSSGTVGGVEITGNNQGLSQSPVNSGIMLHVTGLENVESRVYNDSSNAYAGFIGRRYNGNMISPTQVLANQEVTRYGANPYTSSGWQSTGIGQLRWYTSEDQTISNRGGRAEFWHCAVGSNVLVKTATIDATGITVQGNLRYDINSGNATATQLTSKSTAVTANGRTGQITTSNSSLAKGASVTFTVNNSYITAVTDVPVIAIQSGATVDSYAISVTRVQVGSFNITLTNNGAGPLTDTIIINFAVMRIS